MRCLSALVASLLLVPAGARATTDAIPGGTIPGGMAAADQQATDPTTIPPPIRAMLDAAIASGSDTEVATIVKYARAADPASGDAVQALAQRWHDDRLAANQERVREARFLDLWSGKAEIGGWLTTGNSNQGGATVNVNATREGIDWRQKFHGQLDYQTNLGITTREHYLVDYEPNYKFGPRGYAYGQTQYESDRFLGYTSRASGSVGIGYNVVKTGAIQLDLEAGPAYRYTSFTDGLTQGSAAARGSIDLKWQLARGITLHEVATGYGERYNSTVSSTASLTAKLFGPLAASLSYYIQYESRPATGAVTTDTTSRAGLVYSF